jgi:cytochrome c-type protein NapB
VKKLLLASLIAAATLSLSAPTQAQDGVTSLRGDHELGAAASDPTHKRWQDDQEPIVRDFVHQPPLIPHDITGYQINVRSNKCLTCHSWSNYKSAGATKISSTHFEDRDGNALANVSARRYFCTQCHVPQVNAKPLVENTFRPVDTVRND